MEKSELVAKIAFETQKLEELLQKAKQAEQAADSAIERDAYRTDGSERQDRLHEQILNSTIERAHEARFEYTRQVEIVKELTQQL